MKKILSLVVVAGAFVATVGCETKATTANKPAVTPTSAATGPVATKS